MRIYLTHAVSESGDDYFFLFNEKPSNEQLMKVMRRELGDEADYITSTFTTFKTVEDISVEPVR